MSDFASAHAMKKKYKKEAPIKGHGKLGVEFRHDLPPGRGYPKSPQEQSERLDAEQSRVGEMMRRKPEQLAEGGEADADMIARILHKRTQYMSEGGMVANDVGVAEADKIPAEYDDLVERDELESSYDGDNSGDHLGNAQESDDRKDIVSQIMKSRAKRDRMPRPA